jgi:hypothetical protein
MSTDYDDYDGPPASWTRRVERAHARAGSPADEHGTPCEEPEDSDDSDDGGEE